MKYEKFISQLCKKKRTIDDLVKTIKNSIDEVPVHSFFFGSGCSVYSGIETANSMIEKWRKEIFIENNPDEEYEKSKAIEYLQTNHSDWYNKKYEYSSLFERNYSLPAQRRAYVERIVSKKFPSIGYAYFTKLVEEKFINTAFTTNFDDLINESFYLFSQLRPILCAHDSTIKSVLVTSKRPKVIKLHGDYLFEDIKNTIRETEFLENNMRDKFIEFAKNYGLVLVGYSGGDRSIMDILHYLLKNEDYLKNGLYWCIRKGEDVNDDVAALLWSEKAFFIEIDGFDEFFCEIYNRIKMQPLAISNSFISEDNDKKIEKLINNDFIQNSKSELLKNELVVLKNRKKEDTFDKIIKTISNESDENKSKNKLQLSDQIYLYKLYEDFHNEDYENLVIKINSKLESEQLQKEMESELLEVLVKTHQALNNVKISIETAEKLIKKDSYDLNYLELYLSVETDNNKSIIAINKLISKIKYSSRLFQLKARLFNSIRKNDIVTISKYRDIEIFNIDNIGNIFLEGCRCNKGITNYCWVEYFDLYFDEYKKSKNKDYLTKCNYIVSEYETQNLQAINMIARKALLFTVEGKDYQFISKYIDDNRVEDPDVDKNILNIKIDIAVELNIKDELANLIEQAGKFEDEKLTSNRCFILFDKFNNLDESISILEKFIQNNVATDRIKDQLFDYLLYNDEIERAQDLLKYNEKNTFNELHYYTKVKDWKKALEINENISNRENNKHRYLANKTHALLYLNRYQDVIDLLQPVLEEKKFGVETAELSVNYDLAKSQLGRTKPPSERVERFTKYSRNEMVKVAYYILNRENMKALEIFKKEVKSSYHIYYNYIDCFIIDKVLDDKFKSKFSNVISECN